MGTRRAALLAAFAACSCGRAAARPDLLSLEPVTTEGGPRRFLALELARQAHVTGLVRAIDVSACQWHVSATGALYGDHWGWCEDFHILPRELPGYLLLTTDFTGEMTGGFGNLLFLPHLPGSVDVYGLALALSEQSGAITARLGGREATVRPGESAGLGTGHVLVQPPIDTGHFEPGFDTPLPADVSYTLRSYGLLDSRRVSGRGG